MIIYDPPIEIANTLFLYDDMLEMHDWAFYFI